MRTLLPVSLVLLLASTAGCSKFGSSASGPGARAAQSAGSKARGPAQGKNIQERSSAQEEPGIVGSWIATDGEFQGVRVNPAGLKDMKWTFTADDKVSFTMLGRAMKATYTLDSTGAVKTLDFRGPETDIRGIYELNGDTLKACYASTERPASFATGGTSQDTIMTVFKRVGGRP
jgi:uncharacterized protein (TIGR03067 family)